MMIYLYKKTHNVTGLQYLGKTARKDPHKYKGSGEYWSRHIKKHGYDVTTEILKECETNEEIKQWGMYYSELWNIVDARDENGKKTWANMKPESGKGGAFPGLKGALHPNFGKSLSSKVRQTMKAGWKKRLESGHTPWNKGVVYTEDQKQVLRVPHLKAKGKAQTETHVQARSIALTGREPGFGGKTHSESTKEAQRVAALSRKKICCQHCNRDITINVFNRWHGDNCKHNKGD